MTTPVEEVRLSLPHIELAAHLFGPEDGVPVIALHGWLDNANSFARLAPKLKGLRIIALDMAGHGHSGHRPHGAGYALWDYAHDVLQVAEQLGWKRFGLLGHSMGAGIASLIAAACPQRIERLLAIEALGALAETPERTVARMREALIAHRNLKDKKLRVFPDIDSAVRTRQYASLVPGSGLDEASVRLLVERGLREVEGGYEWSSDPRLTLPTMTRMTEPQIENLVAGIECPVRAIFADPAQPYLPDALRRHRVALLPQGELIVIAGGHHLHMQQVDEAAAAIGGFFGS